MRARAFSFQVPLLWNHLHVSVLEADINDMHVLVWPCYVSSSMQFHIPPGALQKQMTYQSNVADMFFWLVILCWDSHMVMTSERPQIALTKESASTLMSSRWRLLDTAPTGLTTPISHCERTWMHRQFRNDRMNREIKSNCVPFSSPVPKLLFAGSFGFCQQNHYSKGATKCLDFNHLRLQCFILLDKSVCPVLPNTLRIHNSGCSVSSCWTSQSAPCHQTRSGSTIVAAVFHLAGQVNLPRVTKHAADPQ